MHQEYIRVRNQRKAERRCPVLMRNLVVLLNLVVVLLQTDPCGYVYFELLTFQNIQESCST